MLENSGRHVAYSYDALDRLTQEAIVDSLLGDRTFDYTFDAVGNRLTRNDSLLGLTNYAYDANDRLLIEDFGGQITTYTYDDNGNTLSRKGVSENVTYIWDFVNRLTGADTDGNGTVDLVNQYDADGIRTSRTFGNEETRFLIDTVQPFAQVLVEYTPNGKIEVSYMYGNDLISQDRDNTRTFLPCRWTRKHTRSK